MAARTFSAQLDALFLETLASPAHPSAAGGGGGSSGADGSGRRTPEVARYGSGTMQALAETLLGPHDGGVGGGVHRLYSLGSLEIRSVEQLLWGGGGGGPTSSGFALSPVSVRPPLRSDSISTYHQLAGEGAGAGSPAGKDATATDGSAAAGPVQAFCGSPSAERARDHAGEGGALVVAAAVHPAAAHAPHGGGAPSHYSSVPPPATFGYPSDGGRRAAGGSGGGGHTGVDVAAGAAIARRSSSGALPVYPQPPHASTLVSPSQQQQQQPSAAGGSSPHAEPAARRERQTSAVSDCSVALRELLFAGSGGNGGHGGTDGDAADAAYGNAMYNSITDMRGAMAALLHDDALDDIPLTYLQRGGSTAAAAAAAAFGGTGLLFPPAAANSSLPGAGSAACMGSAEGMLASLQAQQQPQSQGLWDHSGAAAAVDQGGFNVAKGGGRRSTGGAARAKPRPRRGAGAGGAAGGNHATAAAVVAEGRVLDDALAAAAAAVAAVPLPAPPRARAPKRTAAVAALQQITRASSRSSESGRSYSAGSASMGGGGGGGARGGVRGGAGPGGDADADYEVVEEEDPADKKRSSQFRGVTRHRRSGRWEAHIWVKEIGRQVYLGGYEEEEHAAEAYDVAALKCKGSKGTRTNFPLTRYSGLLPSLPTISLEELIMAVRRQSQGFSRGSSTYRGVTAHPSGRWESRIGIPGSKHIYLGLFEHERDAAAAYDRSLVRLRGSAAATNFSLSEYRAELAEYHTYQQAAVLRDERMASVTRAGPDFEKWIKSGFKAFPHLASAPVAAAGEEAAAREFEMRDGSGGGGGGGGGGGAVSAGGAAAAASTASPIAAVMAMAAAAANGAMAAALAM
ncbi:hypothetical protein GPECTOR_44g82 [Gonium pectorale]|uniref:AP2/ERF domain-containing protein n=1 Tax=Gonium pectorale TaxID=33097 RepID=A0A150G995_GONPE|nr:hypothetical protein GPECTOR_44g82 [Gonium pectorale]|eukprot:KXZ46408.1 hypothetical protein GPECTOR_44g82 [Gonium pectorale]